MRVNYIYSWEFNMLKYSKISIQHYFLHKKLLAFA